MHHLLRLDRRLRLYRGRRSGLHHRLLNGRLWLNRSLRHRPLWLLHHWLRHRLLLHHRLHAHGGCWTMPTACQVRPNCCKKPAGIATSAHDQEGHGSGKDQHAKAGTDNDAHVGRLALGRGIIVLVVVARGTIARAIAVAVSITVVVASTAANVFGRRVRTVVFLGVPRHNRVVVRGFCCTVKG